MRFETLTVHAGGERDTATGSIAPPLHLSTTYEHGPAGEIPRGWMYIREGNPTQDRLEEALAAVEGGQHRPRVQGRVWRRAQRISRRCPRAHT